MGDQTRLWTKCRTLFRMCRISVWLIILALLCVVLWLNQIGLPDFAKRPLIDALRQHGIALEFVRLRLNFLRGLVADNVHVGGESPDSPSLTLQELQLQINYPALFHKKLQLDGVVLRHGKFILPVSSSNEPPCALIFDHVQTELRFQTNDVWTLDNFQASFAGADFSLSGQVTNATAVSDWGMFHGKRGLRGASQSQLKKIATTLSQIHFNKNSLVSLDVRGDARHLNSFFMFLTVSAPGAQTPWGSAENMVLVAHSTLPGQNAGTTGSPLLEINWKAQLGRLKTAMAGADYVFCGGSWRANGEIDWKTEVTRMHSQKLDADLILCDGTWRAPEVEIGNLYARLGRGQLQSAALLNVNTRELYFTNSSCFDPHAIAGLLTGKMREQLDQFELPRPPALEASGFLILPQWTNDMSTFWRAVKPSARINADLFVTNLATRNFSLSEVHTHFAYLNEGLNGELAMTSPTIGGFSLNEIQAHFAYSNEIWSVPVALVTRTTTRLQVQGNGNDVTKDYQWHIKGALSADVIPPFLTPKAARGFRDFVFAQPLVLKAQVHGRLGDYDSIIANGHVALTNFSLHGESVDSAEADFDYAHQIIKFRHPHLEAGIQKMSADAVRVDWPGDRIYFDNGLGFANPQAVATAIGPLQGQVMSPYHFLAPVHATVNGYAPLRDPTNADLFFKSVEPVQIEILKVRSPALIGELHWAGQTLTLTNLDASLYGGRGTGNVRFDFSPRKGATFTFVSQFQGVDLHGLALDLSTPSNHLENLEGHVSGRFVMTSGYSEDWQSCNGYGEVKLRDGLLWDVPAFGILSPVLNGISPELGNSRATDASGQFFMTNGVIATDNLQIHTRWMLLRCNGTVNLKGGLGAHITAQPLHDIPIIGRLIDTLYWPVDQILEFKVTGTWNNPKVTIRKPISYMLHPIHSLENLAPDKNRKNTQQLPQEQPPQKQPPSQQPPQ